MSFYCFPSSHSQCEGPGTVFRRVSSSQPHSVTDTGGMSEQLYLRPWNDDYQLLCSIDSVSGEIKSSSPFKVSDQLLVDLDNQKATSIESQFKVIETITDYQESKTFRARLSGSISSFWNAETSPSTLDSSRVNCMDMFGYYSLLCTKSRAVINGSTIYNLPLTEDAEKAIQTGNFRDRYGDMIVVGYVTGGKAEAVLRVTGFEEGRRGSIREALRVAMQGKETNTNTPDQQKEQQLRETANSDNSEDATTSATSGTFNGQLAAAVKPGGCHDVMQALTNATTTLITRRTGVSYHDQLHNPSDVSNLLQQLTKDTESTDVKVSALCYRVELFTQIPEDVLEFARIVVDKNTNTLQEQFAQAHFVYNSCEAHLAIGAAGHAPDKVLLREMCELRNESCTALQCFPYYKGYQEVGQLSTEDPIRKIGSELLRRFDGLREKLWAEDATVQQQQLAEVEEELAYGLKLKKTFENDWATALQRNSPFSPSTPAPWLSLPPSLVMAVSQPPQPPQMLHSGPYTGGILHGRVLALRNVSGGKILSSNVQLYFVVKLDSKVTTSPVVSGFEPNAPSSWTYDFWVELSAYNLGKLLAEDEELVLEVYDKNKMMADKFLGAVRVPLREACGCTAHFGGSSTTTIAADADSGEPTWYPVESVVSGRCKCRGELNLALKFITHPVSMEAALQKVDPSCPIELSSATPSSNKDALPRKLMPPLTEKLMVNDPHRVAQQLQPRECNPQDLGYPNIPVIPTIPFGAPVPAAGCELQWPPGALGLMLPPVAGLLNPPTLSPPPQPDKDSDIGTCSGDSAWNPFMVAPSCIPPMMARANSDGGYFRDKGQPQMLQAETSLVSAVSCEGATVKRFYPTIQLAGPSFTSAAASQNRTAKTLTTDSRPGTMEVAEYCEVAAQQAARQGQDGAEPGGED